MTRIKILFVDENEDHLNELKELFIHDSDRWDISYVQDGLSAIELLQEERFQIVITDIEMPIIDGHQLLAIIRERFPHVLRIVFSETNDQETILKVAPLVHRFIAKPCSHSTLRQTIENTLYLNVVLDNESIRRVLIKTTSLPSVPVVYTQLMNRIEQPDFSLKEAAGLISQDMGLCANILKQVNHLGLPETITDLDQAVSLLGLDVIRGIALTTHLFYSMGNIEIKNFSLKRLMRESMLTGLFAKEIVLMENHSADLADDAFVAGVLHQLGTLVFITNFPEKYEQVLDRVITADRPITAVETNLIGVSHNQVGAHLLALWGMPETVLNGVAFYLTPEELKEKSFCTATAVYAAVRIANSLIDEEEYDYLSDTHFESLGLQENYSRWFEKCKLIYEGCTND